MRAQSKVASYVLWGFTLAVLLLIVRLVWLSYDADGAYVALARSTRLQTIELNEFERGNIYDRKGQSFTNEEENCVVVFPELLNLSEDLLRAELTAAFGWTDFEPGCYEPREGNDAYCIQRNLTAAELAAVQDLIDEKGWEGVFATTLAPRYAEDSPISHLLGYVGLPDSAEAAKLQADGLEQNIYIGQTGLERQYDSTLRGSSGELLGIGVDERGVQTTDELRYLNPGNDAGSVWTTLDKDYQQFLSDIMADQEGGAVLLDVASGDILAAVSSPGYDQYQGQTESEGDVYVNKAFSYYPPASVFKLVLAAAALEDGLSTPDDFICTGGLSLSNGRVVHCWEEEGHGKEDLTAALGNSCNPYFVNLGLMLGGDRIKEMVYNLELDRQQIIGYSVNSQTNNVDFNSGVEGDVANASIGENGVRLTPLQVAQLLATIANGGNVITPRLVIGIKDSDGQWWQRLESDQPRQVLSEETAATLRGMLTEAVLNGTGSPVQSEIVALAGKSGTSQEQGVWFAGFAPADEPCYALAVYLADGSSGGKDAGGVFKELMEKIAILEGW